MYAVIETGGKQVRVSEGSVIYVERLDVEAGSAYTFDKVLMLGGESVILVIHTLQERLLKQQLKSKVNKRKLSFSNTNQKRNIVVNKDTDNHIQDL